MLNKEKQVLITKTNSQKRYCDTQIKFNSVKRL